jgi:hypothetical protein
LSNRESPFFSGVVECVDPRTLRITTRKFIMHAAAPAAKPAAPAAGGAAPAPVDPIASLARSIFVHLSGHAAADATPASRSPENAEALARMSYVFAEAFARVDADRLANEAPPPAAFDINTLDFDGWTGKTPSAT